MGSGATKREILEKQLEKRLQDPKVEPLLSLPLDFLEDITGGFSTERILGKGGYGVVYKGVLRSGKTIAIKKIFDKHLLDNYNRVENEIICLKEVKHQNVIQLVGYCVETKKELIEFSGKDVMAEKCECLLCFEFLCNGSLEKYISDDTLALDWDMRYRIIRGVCRGLHYLHDKRRIVHRDLKPQNILMDDMMMPKIGDFDLSRILGQEKSRIVTANVAGTLGYMAPECIEQKFISFEADIFSLGVIIIEIIRGRRDYPSIGERTEMSLKHYTDKVVESWRNRTPMHMSPEMHIQQVEKCISIALMCLEPESKKRPTSLDIVKGLDALQPEYGCPGNSPNDPEEDRRNQDLQSQVNMNIINIPKTISAINDLNDCANLFDWVISAASSLKSKFSGTQLEKLKGDARQMQSDHQCLSDTLPAMYNLIDRAEWRIHDDYVAKLLSKLKDAVYDAEHLLDEFGWYEKKISVEGNAISVEPIIDFFHSVTQGSFNKVAGIQKRLNHLSGQLEKTSLLQVIPRFDKSLRPETTAFPIEPEIFGRDNEKKKLIRMLGVPTNNSTGPSKRKRKRNAVCSSASKQICATIDIDSNEATKTSVPVLPIVGIGGVGKTTLAQDICNNSSVIKHFKLVIWICVSDDFDVKRLTKEALDQSSPPEKVPKTDNLNLLQGALARSLSNKRFLIVLDDMWDENELDWKRFCAPFRNALKGSMMLVTTRSPKVADVVSTMDPFPLEGLNEDAFRKFFKLCVFGSNISNIDPMLERIGEKILPKLRGSPLAAKTLGRLLGMSLDPAHWNRILKSQLWELQQKETDILPALRLSYMYLPFYLRRCFSFCAMYPKDYSFEKEALIEIWAAEGFVQHQPNVSLRHTSCQYFEELAHLSFFQKHPWAHDKYIMHDLIHDMAQLVSKDEYCVIKDTKDFQRIPQNVLHLWVLNGGDVKCCDLLNLCKHKKLRTLLCDLSLESETGDTVMEKWCTELLCMRVIVCSFISKWGLPDSISNLKHLRYLKILNARHCKRFPAAFCSLYNMQILYAQKWEFDDIPNSLGMLINLQKFESVKCQFHHRYIHSVDLHEVTSATDERQRWQFQIKNYNGESLPSWSHPQNSEQIHRYGNTNCTFSSLTDVEIRDCRNLSSLEQFLQPTYIPIIMELKISNCRSLELVPTERFGYFRFLELLSVFRCPKIKSRHLFAPSLKKLYLEDSGDLGYKIECSSLTILHLSIHPLESIELQMYPLLQELEISSCPSLTVIRYSEPISSNILHGEARSRDIDHTFLSLNDVEIKDRSNLSSQEQFLQPVCTPVIMKIKISNCRRLESVPTERFGYFRFLEVLSVSNCPKIKSRHLFAPSLKKLYLEDWGDLGYKIECSSLTMLHLSICPLKSIELQMYPLLQELEISSCPSLTVIRDSEPIASDILHDEAKSRTIDSTLSFLTDVVIHMCCNLSSLEEFLQPGYVPIIKKIEISECGSLKSVPAERFGDMRFLEVLSVSKCPKIKSQRLFAPSLKKLFLEDSGDLGYKIECSSLNIMHLSNCPLESIELQMCNLLLLEELEISSCPSLTVIRDSEPISSNILHGEARSRDIDNTFFSLTDVEIKDCSNLSSQEQFLQPVCTPIIMKIKISNCRRLESVPTERFGYFRFLEVLSVSHCPKIKSRHLFAPSLKKLYLEDCGDLGYKIECSSLTFLHLSNSPFESIELQMWNLPLLQELVIGFCSSLTIIRNSECRIQNFPLLTHLTISFCVELKTINDLLNLPAIESIVILACGLLSLPANRLGGFPRLKDLLISVCPNLNWQSGMLLPLSLQKLGLLNCGDFSALFPSCLENLTSLQELQICHCEHMVSIPDHLWTGNLKSLQRLEFYDCPKLKSIGGPDATAHISVLRILMCPELKEFDQPLVRG